MSILPRILNFRRDAGDDLELKNQVADIAEKYSLSEEESQLVIELLKGMSIKKVALEQKLTRSTVEHRYNTIYRKCGVQSRAGLLTKLKP